METLAERCLKVVVEMGSYPLIVLPLELREEVWRICRGKVLAEILKRVVPCGSHHDLWYIPHLRSYRIGKGNYKWSRWSSSPRGIGSVTGFLKE